MIAYRIELKFTKTKLMRFISHLDLMRLFERATRRADLPIFLTQGFNPHPKISIKRALKLGVASENEEAIFYLKEKINPEEFKSKLMGQLPDGIEIKDLKLIEIVVSS